MTKKALLPLRGRRFLCHLPTEPGLVLPKALRKIFCITISRTDFEVLKTKADAEMRMLCVRVQSFQNDRGT